MGHGYETHSLPDGTVLQAGVRTTWGDEPDWDSTLGFMCRAVVLKTYYVDDASWADYKWPASNMAILCCDVRTIGKRSRELWRVPVCQLVHGVWDEDTYVPRGTTQDMDGAPLAATSAKGPGQRLTEAQSMDGDHVLIGFLESDPKQPVVLPFGLAHPRAHHTHKEADGRTRRIRHGGVLLEWDKDGNFTVDARGAARQELGANGVEVSNAGVAGKIALLTKNGSGQETKVQLDNLGQLLVEAPAKVQITCSNIAMGATPSAAKTLVNHPGWVDTWGALGTLLTTQTGIYSAGAPPPIVAITDYLALIQALNAIAQKYPSLTTINTKAG
jgi:hypothetical protein